MTRRWSPAAEAKLRALYATTPMPRLAFLLKRTENAIGQKAVKLGLSRGNFWSPSEIRTLRKRFPNELTADIARDLGRTCTLVSQKAHALGLCKNKRGKEAARARLSHIAKTNPGCIGGRFKKGQVPANKGLRRPGWSAGRMRETQFKKGEMHGAAQHNYVPIGTQRVNSKDGYLERKVTDDHPVPARRWVAVHRLVWEAANGPIPAGHRVAFKPGTKTNIEADITVDRLELVTAAEMMRRNTIHNYPREIKHAMQMRGALNRVINRRTKEAPKP